MGDLGAGHAGLRANRTTGSDDAWGVPFVVPGTTNVSADDITSMIAFGGNKIGLFWSNQSGSPDADSFSVHSDTDPDLTWSAAETAFAGNNFADDHMNLKTDASGKVYVVVKTSLTGSSQLIKFLVRATNSTWTNYNVATGTDSHTRPILILDQQHSLFRIYMTHGQSGGPIVEKTSSMSSISFPTGIGTPVIWDASANDMNNATSTKQNVDASTGLIVMGFEDTTKSLLARRHLRRRRRRQHASDRDDEGSGRYLDGRGDRHERDGDVRRAGHGCQRYHVHPHRSGQHPSHRHGEL